MKHILLAIVLGLSVSTIASAQTAESYAKQAKEALYGGDDATAVKMLNEAIKLDPKNGKYRYDRAMSQIILDRPAAAVIDLKIAVELDPTLTDAYAHLGATYARMASFRDCVEALDKSIAIKPTAFAYFQRGKCHNGLANGAEAQADFKKAIEMDPSYAKRLN